MNEPQEKQIITTKKNISIRRVGSSFVVTIPADWINTLPFFRPLPDLTAQIIDENGIHFLKMELLRTAPQKKEGVTQ